MSCLKYKYVLILPVCVVMLLSLPLSSQSIQEVQYQEAVRLLESERYNDAARILKMIHKESPDDVRVLRHLGEIEFARERWDDAKGWYERVLQQEPNDLDAQYHLGIIHREQGKYKAFILRTREWNSTEEYFNAVLDSVQVYKDIHYQYGLLEQYRERYDRAVERVEQQLELAPSFETITGAHRFYESFVFNENTNRFRTWAASRSGDLNTLYVAESYRLDKEYATADSIYQELLADELLTVSRVPIFLGLAKSKIEQGQDRVAQENYEQAMLSVLDRRDAALLFENVKYILSNEELDEYNRLDDTNRYRNFFTRIWKSRDPMPASEVNYRLIEHIRRFVVAERDFYYDGFRTQFSNPDRLNQLVFPRVFDLNDKFNDKGLVFIRHGQPDDRSFNVRGGIDTPINESWLYYPRGQMQQKLIFHFLQGETQTGNNWRLVASLPYRYMYENIISWDPIYSRILMGSAVEAIAYEHEMIVNSREYAQLGLNSDQHTWTTQVRTIFFPFFMATFQQGYNKTRSELYYSLNANDVLHKSSPVTESDSVTVNFAVYDLDYNLYTKQSKQVPISTIVQSTDRMGYWPDQLQFIDAPGPFQIALDVRTPNDEAIGGYKFRFNMSNYSGETVKMSGLVLAESITSDANSSPFEKDGLVVMPNPPKMFDRGRPVNVYFELYNLPVNRTLPASFSVEYNVRLLEEKNVNIFQRIGRMFRNPQPSTSNKFERSASQRTSQEYIALDMQKYVPGIYELSVIASVPAVEDTVSRTINFELRK